MSLRAVRKVKLRASLALCLIMRAPIAAYGQQKTLVCDPATRGSVTCESNQNGVCDTRSSRVVTTCSSLTGRAFAELILNLVLGQASTSDDRISRYKNELTTGQFTAGQGSVTFQAFTLNALGIADPVQPITSLPARDSVQFTICGDSPRGCRLIRIPRDSAGRAQAVPELVKGLCNNPPTPTCISGIRSALSLPP